MVMNTKPVILSRNIGLLGLMALLLMMTPSPNSSSNSNSIIIETVNRRTRGFTLTPKTEVKKFRKHRPLKPAEIGFRR